MFQITQEEIGEIIDITEEMCNLEGWTEEALPLAQKRMAIIEKARSRPHTPAPAADQKAPICENCGLDNTTCRMDMAGCLQAQNAAAKAAREQVLDAAIKKLDLLEYVRDPCVGAVVQFAAVIEILESLRAQQQGGVSE